MGLFSKKSKQIILLCYNINDELIQSLKVSELMLKEEYILKVSHEEYNNDEPCVITRSAIAGDLLNNFQKYITSNMAENEVLMINSLQKEFKDGIDWNPQIMYFKLGIGSKS